MNLTKVENRFRIDLKKLNRYTDREDLKVVHYTSDGHIEMTNSLVGIRMKDVYEGQERFEHGNTPESYPNMNCLFDQFKNKKVIENIPIKEFEDIIQLIKKEKAEVIHLNFAPNGIFVEVNDNKSGLHINLDIEKSYQVTLKYDYLLIIIQFMRLLGMKKFDLYYPDTLKPLSFIHENLEIILAPVRNSSDKVYEGIKELEKQVTTHK